MRIPTRDIPQADDLGLVIRSTEAVSNGATSFQEIAREIGGYDPRQGRYYRRAAEIIGLIRNVGRNQARVTPAGRELLHAPAQRQQQLLVRAILNARVFQRVIPFLESKHRQGVTQQQLRQFIGEVTTATTANMLKRRCSSIVGWLTEIGLLRRDGDKFFLQSVPPGVDVVDYAADDEPLSPPSYELTEYEELSRRVRQEARTITMLVNAAARERASDSHRQLTNLVAAKVRSAGAIPKRNRFVDLVAMVGDRNYMFEMKSTTQGNYQSQVRHGVSQLCEYRYLHRLHSAKLVLVTEGPPPRPLRWMTDYLVGDMKILLVWDGDGKTLDCPADIKTEMSFLF